MSKIVVTGGLGFIGSHYVRFLLDTGRAERVTVLDKLTYAACPLSFSAAQRERIDLVRGDICDPEAARRALEGATAVVHMAAESHVDRSIEDAAPFIQTNVTGTYVMLNAALAHYGRLSENEKRGFRFVHVSTDEVYGALGETGHFTENSPIEPNSPYSASKASSDLMARAFFKTFGLPVVITRCSNNYGPNQFPEKFIPVMVLRAMSGEPLPVYGEGKNVRDWIHVMDHCTGVHAALEKGKPGEVYNFGGEAEMRNIDVAKMILDLLGKPHSQIRFVEDRKGHDFRYAIAIERATELGWKQEYSFEKGLRDTVEWYRSNEGWWKAIQSKNYQNLEGWRLK